jgi:hypothetical protein
MRALIAARHLMRAPRLREKTYVNMLDVGARHGERHFVLGFAGGRAGMTADAARVVNNFRPLELIVVGLVNRKLSHW